MMEVVVTVLSLFPVSFLFYSWTERSIARHESRVGKQISFSGFVWQTWIDTILEVGNRRSFLFWVFFAFQCGLPFLFGIRIEYLIFPWLVLNGLVLAMQAPFDQGVLSRIDSDQKQVCFAVSAGVSLLCLTGAFTLSRTADLGAVSWTPLNLVFVVPFQLAGMILFQERPFRGFLERGSWLESVRFYAWCVGTARIFLGGGSHFLEFNVKAGALFMLSRLFGVYFPRFRQSDLLRISTVYLLPVTAALWLAVMLAFSISFGGVSGD